MLGHYVKHRNCHGIVRKRTCSKCGQHWGFMDSLTSPDYYAEKMPSKSPLKSDMKPQRKLTGNPVTDALPNWPRWARISSTLIIVGGVGLVIWVTYQSI